MTSDPSAKLAETSVGFDPRVVTRPDPRLMKYYFLVSLLSGPFFPIVLLPLYFKYETLNYKFDDEGVSMRWGILFRHEVYLTYRRIQDIHLTRNLVQRWLGLATVSVQTASGSSMPEMSIEGIPQAEELRDFFYSRMRGGLAPSGSSGAPSSEVALAEAVDADAGAASGEVSQLLREIRDELRRVADQMEQKSEQNT